MSRSTPKTSKEGRKPLLQSDTYPIVADDPTQDATRPDIVPAALRFAETDEPSEAFVRYWEANSPAYTDWPEVRLAYQETRAHAPRTVLFHRSKRELGHAWQPTGAELADALLERRIRHALVIPVLDVISFDDELLLVMEYVPGVTLSTLERQWSPLPPPIAVAVACDVLRALHAGHRATSPSGELLGLTHGSLSSRDILVGTDGRARVIDFSLAEDTGRTLVERVERNRGYLAPEQVFDRRLDARSDVFTMGAVLWECLTGYALLAGDDPVERLLKLMTVGCDPASRFNAEVPPELDAVIARALQASPEDRFQSAAEFATALSGTLRPASTSDVAERVGSVAKTFLEKQAAWKQRGSEAPPSGTRSVLVARFGSQRPRAVRDARDELTVPDRPLAFLRDALASESGDDVSSSGAPREKRHERTVSIGPPPAFAPSPPAPTRERFGPARTLEPFAPAPPLEAFVAERPLAHEPLVAIEPARPLPVIPSLPLAPSFPVVPPPPEPPRQPARRTALLRPRTKARTLPLLALAASALLVAVFSFSRFPGSSPASNDEPAPLAAPPAARAVTEPLVKERLPEPETGVSAGHAAPDAGLGGRDASVASSASPSGNVPVVSLDELPVTAPEERNAKQRRSLVPRRKKSR
ncbi:MAG TPA: serine/threonine-protein kinase [Polyangiaceae bacterium]